MIKMAFCDDDVQTLAELQSLLERYRREVDREIVYTAFHSPLELLAAIEEGARYDVLFLDILMPGQNGMETAEEIRGRDGDVKIVFLTSSTEFAVQSYLVNAHFYQLKPIRWESFSRVMDSVMESCRKERGNRLVLRCREGITSIDLTRLEFCEVIHRTLMLHMSTGKVLESTGSLDELEGRLASGFLRVHRSYIVNLDYIQSISYRAVVMASLAEIPIPRGRYSEIKDAFLAYAFRNGQVGL